MSTKLVPATLAAVLLGGTAIADVPSVAVDIAPVHSLVARVMDGVGSPDLVIPPGASPHEYSLRPSEAEAFWSTFLISGFLTLCHVCNLAQSVEAAFPYFYKLVSLEFI